MNSIPYFDDHHPVRTVYTGHKDWQNGAGWQNAGDRNAALEIYLRTPVTNFCYARETHSGSVFAISYANGEYLAAVNESCILGPPGGYDAIVTDIPGVLICIWTADCLPVFLYDTKNRIYGADCPVPAGFLIWESQKLP